MEIALRSCRSLRRLTGTQTKETILKTSSCKAKGRKLQQYVAEQISNILDIPWGKDELIRSRGMGQSGVDVPVLGKAKEKFPWSVECKNTEKLNLWDAIRQARDNQQDGTDWLLVVKKNQRSCHCDRQYGVF